MPRVVSSRAGVAQSRTPSQLPPGDRGFAELSNAEGLQRLAQFGDSLLSEFGQQAGQALENNRRAKLRESSAQIEAGTKVLFAQLQEADDLDFTTPEGRQEHARRFQEGLSNVYEKAEEGLDDVSLGRLIEAQGAVTAELLGEYKAQEVGKLRRGTQRLAVDTVENKGEDFIQSGDVEGLARYLEGGLLTDLEPLPRDQRDNVARQFRDRSFSALVEDARLNDPDTYSLIQYVALGVNGGTDEESTHPLRSRIRGIYKELPPDVRRSIRTQAQADVNRAVVEEGLRIANLADSENISVLDIEERVEALRSGETNAIFDRAEPGALRQFFDRVVQARNTAVRNGLSSLRGEALLSQPRPIEGGKFQAAWDQAYGATHGPAIEEGIRGGPGTEEFDTAVDQLSRSIHDYRGDKVGFTEPLFQGLLLNTADPEQREAYAARAFNEYQLYLEVSRTNPGQADLAFPDQYAEMFGYAQREGIAETRDEFLRFADGYSRNYGKFDENAKKFAAAVAADDSFYDDYPEVLRGEIAARSESIARIDGLPKPEMARERAARELAIGQFAGRDMVYAPTVMYPTIPESVQTADLARVLQDRAALGFNSEDVADASIVEWLEDKSLTPEDVDFRYHELRDGTPAWQVFAGDRPLTRGGSGPDASLPMLWYPSRDMPLLKAEAAEWVSDLGFWDERLGGLADLDQGDLVRLIEASRSPQELNDLLVEATDGTFQGIFEELIPPRPTRSNITIRETIEFLKNAPLSFDYKEILAAGRVATSERQAKRKALIAEVETFQSAVGRRVERARSARRPR